MGLFLKPASETDFPRIVEILAAANAQDPWMRIMKPGQPPPRARVKTIDRFLNEHLNDPVVEYMAVEDSEQNELIAFARWNMYRKERPDDEWKKEPNIQWDEGREFQITDPSRSETVSNGMLLVEFLNPNRIRNE